MQYIRTIDSWDLLNSKIVDLRDILNDLVNTENLHSDCILAFSQEIDKAINSYYEMHPGDHSGIHTP